MNPQAPLHEPARQVRAQTSEPIPRCVVLHDTPATPLDEQQLRLVQRFNPALARQLAQWKQKLWERHDGRPARPSVRLGLATIYTWSTRRLRWVGRAVPTLLVGGALLIGLAGAPRPVLAADVSVTTTTDEDDGSLGGGSGVSLREAILYSTSGDTIILPAGTYLLTLDGTDEDAGATGDLDIPAGKSLTINGAGAAQTTIRASFSAGNGDRVLHLAAGAPGATATLTGLTISGGSIDDGSGGGGILAGQGTSLTLTDSIVSGNTASSNSNGGGILLDADSTLQLTDSTVSGNTTDVHGGGIFTSYGTDLTLTGSTVTGNESGYSGGGVYSYGATTISGSTISSNTAGESGGGLWVAGEDSLTIDDSEISDNTAQGLDNGIFVVGGDGGGLWFNAVEGTITDSVISGNTSGEYGGGGIYLFDTAGVTASLTLVNTTLADNSAETIQGDGGNGGAIGTYGYNVEVNLINSTISGNSAVGNGGGIYVSYATLTLTNTTITDNDADVDGDDVGDGGGLFTGYDTVSAANTIIAGNDDESPAIGILHPDISGEVAGDSTNLVGDLDGASGTIGTGSDIVDGNHGLAPLADNGGATPTHLLQAGSPAIDAATNATCAATPVGNLDQRGRPRANDGDGDGIAACDIGAVELQNTLSVFQAATAIPDGGSYNFGTTPVGTPVVRSFTITNTGDLPVTLTPPISVPAGYTVVSSFGSTNLAPGASTSFSVRLNATAAGTFNGTLSFATSLFGAGNPYNITINGVVQAQGQPTIQVTDGATVINDGGSVNYGTTSVGSPIAKTFTVRNTGSGTLTLTPPINVPAGYTVVSSFGSTTLSAGQSTTFVVRLNATAAGTFNGTLSFGTNVSGANPFNFTLNGVVQAQGQPAIQVLVGSTPIADGGSHEFGTTPVGTPVTRTFTVRNTGTSVLTLTPPISVPAGYTVVSSFGSTTIAPGQSTTFVVRLNATAAGTFNGTLSFGTNVGSANPFNFTVRGTVQRGGFRLYLPFMRK